MADKMLILHVATVTLFLVLFIFKIFLLLFNKRLLLSQIRNKTKIVDVIVGGLIFISGIYLIAVIGNTNLYMVAKVILVLIAIPLGIVGLKNNSKFLSMLAVVLFIYIYGIAETKNLALKGSNYDLEDFTFQSDQADEILKATESATLQQGKVIYKVLCVECHGEDGQSELPGTANLAETKLKTEEKIVVITVGRGEMKGFDAELSEHEIELVAAYTETLQ